MVKESIPKEGETLRFKVINMMVIFIVSGQKPQF